MPRKRDKGIRVSPQHGLNPSIERCPICGKEMGIVLYGKLKDDVEAPKYSEMSLCEDCRKQYITLLEANDNRKPTGRRMFIKREAVSERFRNEDTLLMRVGDFEDTIKLINDLPE